MEADKKHLGLELAKALHKLQSSQVNDILYRVWSKEELDDYALTNIKSLADVHKYMRDVWAVSPIQISSTPSLEKKINAAITVQNIVAVLNHAGDCDPERLWYIRFIAVTEAEFFDHEYNKLGYEYLGDNIAYGFDSWEYNTFPLDGYPLNSLQFESLVIAEHFLKYFKSEICTWLNCR